MVCACCNLDGCPSGGACCVDGECVDGVSQAECASLGGTWLGCCVRCHPRFNANTGQLVYPCNDTTTPTCCDTLWSRVSQVVLTVAGAAEQPSTAFLADLDCECFNGTYILDADDFVEPGQTQGLYSSSTLPDECDFVPLVEDGEIYTNIREVPVFSGSFSCFSTQLSTIANDPDAGVLWMGTGFAMRLLYQVFADSVLNPFLPSFSIANAELNGGSGGLDPLAKTVECGRSCDELVDEMLAQYPYTVSLTAGAFVGGEQPNQCQSPSQATLTVDLQ
jgi:hypothetical protein